MMVERRQIVKTSKGGDSMRPPIAHREALQEDLESENQASTFGLVADDENA